MNSEKSRRKMQESDVMSISGNVKPPDSPASLASGASPEPVRHNSASLARELAVSRRTVHRDLDVLELAGIPCPYIAEQNSYVLRGDYRFAVAGLTDDELLGPSDRRRPDLGEGPGRRRRVRGRRQGRSERRGGRRSARCWKMPCGSRRYWT